MKTTSRFTPGRSLLNCAAMLLLLLGAAPAFAQQVLLDEDFSNGTAGWSVSGNVYTGSYGLRLRGGSASAIARSPTLAVAGPTTVTLQFDRDSFGLDAGETASAFAIVDGAMPVQLESLQNASGSVSHEVAVASSIALEFRLDASSFYETLEVHDVLVTADSGGSTACSGQTLTPGESTRTVSVGGVTRSYILYVPQSYDGHSEVPLLLDFHPLLSDADYQFNSSGTREVAEANGFIAAYPDGIDDAWNIGPCCTQSRDVDDLGFALAVVDEISSQGCIDASRVYATGYSNGGGMAYHLACEAADVFAAVAPAAFDLVEEMSCAPSRPVPVYAYRGRLDFIVPYSGGASTPPTPYPLDPIHFLGAEDSFETWADLNACSGSPVDIGDNCDAYLNCAGGSEVVLCTETFGSHSPWDAEQSWSFMSSQQLQP